MRVATERTFTLRVLLLLLLQFLLARVLHRLNVNEPRRPINTDSLRHFQQMSQNSEIYVSITCSVDTISNILTSTTLTHQIHASPTYGPRSFARRALHLTYGPAALQFSLSSLAG